MKLFILFNFNLESSKRASFQILQFQPLRNFSILKKTLRSSRKKTHFFDIYVQTRKSCHFLWFELVTGSLSKKIASF